MLLISSLILIWPALHQNSPILTFDSVGYLMSTFLKNPDYFQGRAYPYFLYTVTFGGRISLLSVPFLQSLIACILSFVLFKQVFPKKSFWIFFTLSILGISLLTNASIYLSQISPDFFSMTLFLSFFLLIFYWKKISGVEKAYIIFTAILSAFSHHSNLPILMIFLLTFTAGQLFLKKRTSSGISIMPAWMVLGSLVLVLFISHLGFRDNAFGRGPLYLLSRMIFSGRISEALETARFLYTGGKGGRGRHSDALDHAARGGRVCGDAQRQTG